MGKYDVLDDLSLSPWHTDYCFEALADTVLEFPQDYETIVDEDTGVDNDMICKECNGMLSETNTQKISKLMATVRIFRNLSLQSFASS